jgi:hypothetical protein
MEKVMYVKIWDHVQMHVSRAAFAAIAGGIVGCSAHTIPSTAVAQLPFAGPSISAMNSGEALLPDAKTSGGMRLFDDQSRVVRLANFDLSEPAPRDTATPLNMDARVAMLAEFVRYRQRRSEQGALSLPGIHAPMSLTPGIVLLESPDRTGDLLLTYHLAHAFDLTRSCGESMKSKTGSISIIADDALYMMRQSPVESTVSFTVIASN